MSAAEKAGSGFILQFDGNLWAGNSLIPGDPRPQNRNGKMLEQFLTRNQHLKIVNALPQCKGLITRRRMKNGEAEESILDLFIVCNKVLPFVTNMVIDEEKIYVLTNYKQYAKKRKAIDSDHMTEYMDLNIEVEPAKPERIEIYNYKDEASKVTFKKLTSETEEFTKCFQNQNPLLGQIENWTKLMDKYCSKSFKKIRIKKNDIKPINPSLKKLINQRNSLLKYPPNFQTGRNIEDITKRIYEIETEENRNKMIKNFEKLSDNLANVNLHNVWKKIKQIWPKNGSSIPTAKKNHQGHKKSSCT